MALVMILNPGFFFFLFLFFLNYGLFSFFHIFILEDLIIFIFSFFILHILIIVYSFLYIQCLKDLLTYRTHLISIHQINGELKEYMSSITFSILILRVFISFEVCKFFLVSLAELLWNFNINHDGRCLLSQGSRIFNILKHCYVNFLDCVSIIMYTVYI